MCLYIGIADWLFTIQTIICQVRVKLNREGKLLLFIWSFSEQKLIANK